MKVIKDSECGKNSPVTYGNPEFHIYGLDRVIVPRYTGKRDTDYEKKIFLPELLPLEAYDLIIILFSGGKDSTAAYFKLLELGVPKWKIELWHHDINGGHPDRRMDWPVTQAYVKAFAEAEGVTLRVSRRVNGFWGEVYRIGASYPIEYWDKGEFKTCRLTDEQHESERLRQKIIDGPSENDFEQLKSYGHRMKFPAKSADLNWRWCSAYLKISVASAVLRNLESLRQANDVKILIVSGERRGESTGRAKYNEMEKHTTNAMVRAKRLVHQWRAVIDYSERDVWEVLKRHRIVPHPCYSCGWNRCSCAMCIFGLPRHWAGIRELFPEEYEAFCQDEVRLAFTLDNKKTLDEYVGDAESCVYHGDKKVLHQLITGQFSRTDIYQDTEWKLPAGAFRGSDGGPC